MKNKKVLKVKKLKKNVKGITLIALVVTVIVLLILAGVAINLTVGDNGLFRRAQNAADTWQMAEINEQIEMDKASNFIEDYMNGGGDESGITWHGDVPIPNGFYYVGGEENTGLIISDSLDDANKGDNLEASEYVGNQFVWVPVENPSSLIIEETVKLNGVETTTNVYSKLTVRSGDSYTAGKPGTTKAREPDILNSYDTDAQYYKTILGFDSTKAMADSFVQEYKAMSDSIKKYKGFYIGRYELTANGEKKGTSITNTNWYNLYKACQNVIQGKQNVKSTMIYGVQWDAVCSWLKQSGFDTDTDSSSWGNYSSSSKMDTGSDKKYEANRIFDLAGNCWEWTQEAYFSNYRVTRGGRYNGSESNYYPASARVGNVPYDLSNSYISSRATLYIK